MLRTLARYCNHFIRRSGIDAASTTSEEANISAVLKKRFPEAKIGVKDVSGGCGAMFEIYVRDKEFHGLRVLQQHRLVNETLKKEISEMHGLRITTESETK